MKRIITIHFELPNPLAILLRYWQVRRLNRFWDSQASWIDAQVKADFQADARFKWSLVWQELSMWTHIGESVTPSDVEYMVRRRGFDPIQWDFINRALTHIWLLKTK